LFNPLLAKRIARIAYKPPTASRQTRRLTGEIERAYDLVIGALTGSVINVGYNQKIKMEGENEKVNIDGYFNLDFCVSAIG
jgi:hypothetical protein